MEAREILVMNSNTQTKNKVVTDATTLGELKAALDAEGINYANMTFTEGISGTQFVNDDSLLPTNVMFKGSPTNNLVILLTNTKKNIQSGCETKNRKMVYEIIKDMGSDFEELIKEKFGRNYTQVPTVDLWAFIEESNTADNDVDDEDYEDDEFDDENENEEDQLSQETANVIYDLIKQLVKQGTLSTQEVETIIARLEELCARTNELNGVKPNKTYQVGNIEITDNELDNIAASL